MILELVKNVFGLTDVIKLPFLFIIKNYFVHITIPKVVFSKTIVFLDKRFMVFRLV